MVERITDEDLELLGELGVESTATPTGTLTATQQRVIAGFEEIERFAVEQGRLPQNGEERDIFERLYAVRLDQIRQSPDCRAVVASLDTRGLLDGDAIDFGAQELSDEELLASLGVEADGQSEVTRLVHVRSRAEINAAEEVAQRAPCPDFDIFKPLFALVQGEIESGARHSIKYRDNADIAQGDWFIVEGQKAFVAEMGEPFVSDYGRPDRRLRVVYGNATQNELLLRSLQRALNRDKASRRITALDDGENLSLFAESSDATDDGENESVEISSGTIYVCRSLSDHPFIAENRQVIHKIGVTGGAVAARVANAKNDPTFLLAEVKIVATLPLKSIERHKLEAMLHKFFINARLDMELKDRFEVLVKPREWFFVPLDVIGQAVDKINEGTLDGFRYDKEQLRLVAQ